MLHKTGIRIYSMTEIGARLTALALSFCLLFVNIPLSFADFASDGEQALTATVTVGAAPGDTDFDGMDNAWESQYGLDPNNPEDAIADNDDDGFTNLEEYRMGTDPLISESSIAAYITKTPASGTQPLDVTLTANVTNDGGNDIVKYEWDFDGNGTYDYASTDNSVAYKFTASGQQNVKLRVTNAVGFIAIARETIDVTKVADSPTATVGINAIDSTVPVAVAYSGFGTDSGSITSYEWELTGDGESDFKSVRSASVTYTYKETRSKSFYPYLKVTNAKGLSDIALLGLGVNLNAGRWYAEPDNVYRPRVVIDSGYVAKGKKAGEVISFSAYGIPVGGNSFGYAKKLEWDFESDGIYDWVTEINSPNWSSGRADVTHVYGTPGVYRATLKVTTEANLTATDHVLVIVEEGAGNPPGATAKVNYTGNNNKTSITGTVPLVAEFMHKNSSGNIAKYEWDFDGDKRFDYSTAENNPQSNKPFYTYTVPGYYLACLRVTGENGLTDTDYIPVFVTMPATYASAITTPQASRAVAGNSVTLICNVFPDNSGVNSVMFQYSADSGLTWNNIGLGEQVSSYVAMWDTTVLIDGDYLIRAIVNNVDSASFITSAITISNADTSSVDIYENTEAGKHTKKEKINPGQSNEISLPGGATIEIPVGSLPQGGLGNIYIEVIDNSVATGGTIEINLIGAASFTSDIIISLPYPDENQDGIVDGTNISEDTLTVNWFNENTNQWEAIYDSVVYPEENIVSARISHLSIFGWGAGGILSIITGGGSSSAGEGGVSYCFIATACYGSADAKEVMALRQFRDAFLMKDNLGKNFVNCYYKYSPPVAKYIENKQTLKKIVRLALKPIVKFAQWKLKERK